MAIIKLTQNKEAIVDDEDFEYLNQWKWYYMKNGYICKYEYNNNKKNATYLHRLILADVKEVDHIDRNKLNNKRNNLRPATRAQNMANTGLASNNTSGKKGVVFDKERNKYRAQIKINGKTYNLGRFDTIDEAATIYDSKLKQVFGEYAFTNQDIK